MTRVDYSNGAYITYTYDDLNRISEIANVGYGGATLAYDYTYNGDSNVTRVDIEFGPYTYYKLYEYDELHRLVEEEKYNSSNTLLYSYDYTYDAVGNRLTMAYYNGSTTTNTSYTYNSLNQLTQRSKGGSYSYAYDDNGNMTNENLGIDLRHFDYNLDDRMTQAIIDEEDTYDFEYELGGKLLLKTYADGSQRKYYYDGIRVILEKAKPAQGSWTTSKVYTLAPGGIGFIIGERENSTDKWYHYDLLGNVMAQTNSSGQALATYEQDAFGNVLSGSSSGYHLTTKDNHTDIGLYYFYQRWYDPMLGRFTIKTIYPTSVEHQYLYCSNNSINYYDSIGLKECPKDLCSAKGNPDFCRDWGPGNVPGQKCFRWIKSGSNKGLHCCYDKNTGQPAYPEHNDKVNPSIGRGPGGFCIYGPIRGIVHIGVDTIPGWFDIELQNKDFSL